VGMISRFGTAAYGVIERALFAKVIERDRLTASLMAFFPDDFELIITAIDKIGLMSFYPIDLRIRQMWLKDSADFDELRSIYDACPMAFQGFEQVAKLVGRPAKEVTQAMLANLP
jgi:hypothetical protein